MAARPPGAVTGETGVVSVSPGHATSDVREVFLSPRLVDQHAFDELAGTLRGLIDQADTATRQLEERQQWFASNAGEPAQAAARLQERLRLSAQMLKAFQTQIDRVESTLETLDTSAAVSEDASAQLQARLDGFQAGLHERQPRDGSGPRGRRRRHPHPIQGHRAPRCRLSTPTLACSRSDVPPPWLRSTRRCRSGSTGSRRPTRGWSRSSPE